ncbi:MAG TPA: permease prefix domain 1-containing protein, partial [Candidatus Angelobacter sp.]
MYWLRRLFRKGHTEKQLDSELRFHVEEQIASNMKAGMGADEARRRAQVEFGGLEGIKEECRESRRVHLFETLLQDVRYGWRMMLRTPAFTVVAVLTLALGIGANTAIFSVVEAAVLRGLPYPNPERLVHLWESHKSGGEDEFSEASYPDYLDWKSADQVFEAVGG